MKKFILRWREDNSAVVRSAIIKVDDVDAGFFRLHIYRPHANGTVRRSTKNYGTALLTEDIMGLAPKGHIWINVDGDKTNYCRSNLALTPKNLRANITKRKLRAEMPEGCV